MMNIMDENTAHNLLNTEMMNLFNRTDVGTIKTGKRFSENFGYIVRNYGLTSARASYKIMLPCCHTGAVAKIVALVKEGGNKYGL